MDKHNNFLSNYPMEDMKIDYIEYSVIIIIVMICMYCIWFIINKKTQAEKKTKKQVTLEKIQKLDFESHEHKQLAYDFTLLIKNYLEQKDEQFEEILEDLKEYKYHNKKQNIDIKIINKMKRFIDELE